MSDGVVYHKTHILYKLEKLIKMLIRVKMEDDEKRYKQHIYEILKICFENDDYELFNDVLATEVLSADTYLELLDKEYSEEKVSMFIIKATELAIDNILEDLKRNE